MNLKSFEKGMKRKNTNCYKWDLTKKRFGVDECNPMWIADSDYPTCPAVVKDLVKRAKDGAFGYSYASESYKEAVKGWIKRHHYYDIETTDIVTTPGVVCALFFIIKKYTTPGDNILISTPVYNPFYDVIKDNGCNIINNKLKEIDDSYQIDFEDLEEKMKISKMYILCNPHNPVGRVWTKDEVDKIFNLCKKYNCFLVSDEIHADIIMKPNKLYSAGNYLDMYDKLIVCTAPSKTFNVAGLQDSNIIIRNKELRDGLYELLHMYSISDPNIFGAIACESAYTNGDEWMEAQNEYLKENYEILKKYFNDFAPQAKVYKLEGTYLVWVNLSYLGLSQEELFKRIVDNGVVINNGTVYGEDYIGYIRINIACGRNQLMDALERIIKAIK